jgi:hypothetical protein
MKINLKNPDSCIGCPCVDKWPPKHIFCQMYGEVIPAEYDEQFNLTKAERLKRCKEEE